MAVPGGYGASQLDFTCCHRGLYLAIEAKAGKNWLTGPQRALCREVLAHGGKVFIISNAEGLAALVRYLGILNADNSRSNQVQFVGGGDAPASTVVP